MGKGGRDHLLQLSMTQKAERSRDIHQYLKGLSRGRCSAAGQRLGTELQVHWTREDCPRARVILQWCRADVAIHTPPNLPAARIAVERGDS